jgi:gamma-glutamylcyclotransferase (GGCT)/AIG2-like uncharacterized protein YtfP
MDSLVASDSPARPAPAPALRGHVLYFAYGANMRREAFCRLCPGADWLGVARLEGYRVVIAWHGYASLVPDSASTVWGALWLVPAACLPALDGFEGVAEGLYIRDTARITSPAGPRGEAMIYRAPRPDLGLPTAAYLAEVLAGAKENKLPAAHQAALAKLAAPARPAGQ